MPGRSSLSGRVCSWPSRLMVAVAAASVGASVALAQPVFVRAGEDGRGVLRGRAGDCFLLTPEHVLAGRADVSLIAAGRLEGRAELEGRYPPDLALLRVRSGLGCDGFWDEGRKLDDLLAGAEEGTIVSAGPEGSLERRRVRLVSTDERIVRVRPVETADRLFAGLSGSLLEVSSRPAGMLVQVDVESHEGIVYRQDYVSDLVRRFFDASVKTALPATPDGGVDPRDEMAVATKSHPLMERPDRLAATVGRIDVGDAVRITGRVRDRLWYRVENPKGGGVAYVPTSALEPL